MFSAAPDRFKVEMALFIAVSEVKRLNLSPLGGRFRSETANRQNVRWDFLEHLRTIVFQGGYGGHGPVVVWTSPSAWHPRQRK